MTTDSPTTRSFTPGADIPDYDFITNCMHCGLCLPTCPTYQLTGLETSSPRGRIRLIKSVADGTLPITEGFIKEMNFCLDCQACETACPAGVRYGQLVESARAQIYHQGFESATVRAAKRFFFRTVFGNRSYTRALGRIMRIVDLLGIKDSVAIQTLLRMVPGDLGSLLQLTPNASQPFSSDVLPTILKPQGTPRYRVGFLTGCLMDVSFAEVNIDTVALLLYHGCEVVIPPQQACCGSLPAHFGDTETARILAERNTRAFTGAGKLDYIVINSAGCGAYMKEYGHVLRHNETIKKAAEEISAKTLDITEFLDRIGLLPATNHREANALVKPIITYHDACHLAHTQKVSEQPRRLLRSLTEFEYRELPEASWCCGSAGIYNITEHEASMQILDRKMMNLNSVDPDYIVTGNPGCMVQIAHGLKKEGRKAQVVHTASFLRKALLPVNNDFLVTKED